jgi:hypothetical protein
MNPLVADLILPRHPRWKQFVARLAGADACNFGEDSWTCFGDLRFTRRILAEMGIRPAPIEVCVAYFKDHGGYCDCEVVINVARER